MEKTCGYCGKSFSRRPSKYCSKVCGYLAIARARSGASGPDVKRQCKNCGAVFMVPWYRRSRTVCSLRCVHVMAGRASAAKVKTGPRHHSWKGGRTARSYRRVALVGRAVACQICGPTDRKLEVHHVNGNPLDNRPSNLQVVCRSCHRKIHRTHERFPQIGDSWAFKWDRCRDCGRTDRRHRGRGYCRTCYMRRKRNGQFNPLLS